MVIRTWLDAMKPTTYIFAIPPLHANAICLILAAADCCSRQSWSSRRRRVSRSSAEEFSDCNVEECAPDKEIGKVSVKWLAGDKTKVVGTTRLDWVCKQGQTNIYSVEPAVYVAESAISSGAAGSSADGSGNTVTVVAGIALVFVAAAASILLLVGKNQPAMLTTDYSGPSLSYYINKFELQGTVKASVPTATETPAPGILQPVESEQET